MSTGWSAEKKMLGGFGVALLVLCIVAGLSIWVTLALLGNLQAVSDRNANLQAISEFRNSMSQMSAAARLFASNGSEGAFSDWEKLRQDFYEKTKAAKERFPQDSLQLARVQAMAAALQEKIDQTKRDADRAALQKTWSVETYTTIRNLLQDMDKDEQDYLAQRNAQATKGAHEALWTIGAASVLAVVMVSAAAALVMRDLRGRQRAAEELERARKAAEAASVAKSAFLANMSHELRTPLTSIMGYADLLLEPDAASSRRHEFLRTMRRSSEHLLTLINDILDVSKIEAGRMSVEKVECRVPDVLADIDSLMRSRATEKGIAFSVEYLTPIPERVRTDPTRLRQILMNLVGNAVKFTDQGSVKVALRYEGQGAGGANGDATGAAGRAPNNGTEGDHATAGGQAAETELAGDTRTLSIEVIDTGVGIAADKQESLFQPFTQADVSTTRRFGGTGLGLSISRRLARMLGGDLTVQSRLQVGSTFRLALPMEMVEGATMLRPEDARALVIASAHPAPAPAVHLDVRVLLAEDGVENREVILLHLRQAGCRVSAAEDGQQAFDAAMEAVRAGKAFDVILMDMQMPVMDGYTATKKLRAAGYKGVIIALTAHAMKEDREACLRAGCDEYAAKPVDMPALLQLIARFCGSSDAVSVKMEVIDNAVLRNLARKFCEALPQTLEDLRSLSRSERYGELAAAVHKLIGATGAYGFVALTQEARALENLVRDRAGRDKIDGQIGKLETAAGAAREMLESVEVEEQAREKAS